jgi:hypothetical protein
MIVYTCVSVPLLYTLQIMSNHEITSQAASTLNGELKQRYADNAPISLPVINARPAYQIHSFEPEYITECPPGTPPLNGKFAVRAIMTAPTENGNSTIYGGLEEHVGDNHGYALRLDQDPERLNQIAALLDHPEIRFTNPSEAPYL